MPTSKTPTAVIPKIEVISPADPRCGSIRGACSKRPSPTTDDAEAPQTFRQHQADADGRFAN